MLLGGLGGRGRDSKGTADEERAAEGTRNGGARGREREGRGGSKSHECVREGRKWKGKLG